MSSYYLKRSGKLYGPFSEDKLKILINNGTFGEEDQVTSDQISWQTVQDFRLTMNIPPYDPAAAGAQNYDPNCAQPDGYDPNCAQQPGYDPNYAQQGGYDPNYAQQGGYDPNYAQQPGYDPNYAQQGGYAPNYAQQISFPKKNHLVVGFILAGVLLLGIIGAGFFFFSSKSGTSSKLADKFSSKISVSVTVKKWFYLSGESWKYNCEYKLYANDQLVASRNSSSMSVTFNVKVDKGASLRAEMLPKNGFGAIAETLEGPKFNKTATATYSGESITIECH